MTWRIRDGQIDGIPIADYCNKIAKVLQKADGFMTESDLKKAAGVKSIGTVYAEMYDSHGLRRISYVNGMKDGNDKIYFFAARLDPRPHSATP